MPRALYRQIGQLLFAGFDGLVLPVELKSLAREFSLGGVVFFKRNVEAPAQVAEVSREIAQLDRELPPWVAVDQEGGRVARFRKPFTEWPPMAVLGKSGDERLAERFARALARELRAVGVSLDFAPVLDIHTNPRNPVIGDRALADRPDVVASLGAVIIRALQEEGIAACGKHFPGHGDTSQDTHHELAIVEHPPDRLRAVEFEPFRAAIAAGVTAIMSAHVLVPAFDNERPATLSPTVLGLLRDELGFDGLLCSDDLDMKAVSASRPVPDAALAAIVAGCDATLICSGRVDVQAAAIEGFIRAVEQGALSERRVEDAIARQRRAKERFLAARTGASVGDRQLTASDRLQSMVGCDEHQAIADEMARLV
jgi:beta-N-acetylhexosaminidase